MGKKYKIVVLALILFIGSFMLTPFANALENQSKSIRDIRFYTGANSDSPFTKIILTLNDDIVVDKSYILISDESTSFMIYTSDFKIVENTNPETIEEYNAGKSITNEQILTKGTTLYYYNNNENLLKSEKVKIIVDWRNNNKQYFYEEIAYTVKSDGSQGIENINLEETTEKRLLRDEFYEAALKKYPFIVSIQGDEKEVTYGYEINSAPNTKYAIIGTFSFKEKTLEQLLNELDTLINQGKATINNDDTILKNNELVQIKNNKVLTTYEKIENNNLLYSWSFDGNKMTADDIKLNIDLNLILGLTPNKDKIDALIPSSIASLKLDFQHKGNLPLGTSLKVNIGSSFKNDDILDLYYYNPEANKLEKVAENIMVIDGFASFPISHCSEYVLVLNKEANKNADNNVQTSSMNVILYTIITIVCAGALGYIIKNKNKEIA